mmetsp:Transcript_38770/g.99524  ORF Transcript_38770/g.99524 Transcript_38770/m.99524 type:complete len:223 (+) Transcript_38770:230-898(+)
MLSRRSERKYRDSSVHSGQAETSPSFRTQSSQAAWPQPENTTGRDKVEKHCGHASATSIASIECASFFEHTRSSLSASFSIPLDASSAVSCFTFPSLFPILMCSSSISSFARFTAYSSSEWEAWLESFSMLSSLSSVRLFSSLSSYTSSIFFMYDFCSSLSSSASRCAFSHRNRSSLYCLFSSSISISFFSNSIIILSVAFLSSVSPCVETSVSSCADLALS